MKHSVREEVLSFSVCVCESFPFLPNRGRLSTTRFPLASSTPRSLQRGGGAGLCSVPTLGGALVTKHALPRVRGVQVLLGQPPSSSGFALTSELMVTTIATTAAIPCRVYRVRVLWVTPPLDITSIRPVQAALDVEGGVVAGALSV